MSKNKNPDLGQLFIAAALVLLSMTSAAYGQGTAFTYQGRLTDGGNPANGNFDMQFKLFDTATVGTGTQQGLTITNPIVQVTDAVFNVQLDFGGGVFDGSARFLEIGTRPAGSPNPYIVLAPRQPITSTPYTIRSISATTADTATSANQLGGLTASGFVQNTTSQQAATNFNISGDGSAGGTLTANVVNTATQYNIAGSQALSVAGTNNLFVGVGAGASNSTGANNAFVGRNAGFQNTTGDGNAFFGAFAGRNNTTVDGNSFFGASAGFSNTSGFNNSFFGSTAGFSNSTAISNSFFGSGAGFANTTGNSNSFFGTGAGENNTTASGNSFFGTFAGRANTAGSNSFFGASAGGSNTTGSENSFFGAGAGGANTTGSENSFFGRQAGLSNTEGLNNSFFGALAGELNTIGESNSFFGRQAGLHNTTGNSNSFFGASAGFSNASNGNSFFGNVAGFSTTTGNSNSFFGNGAGQTNTTGSNNTFFGASTGLSNTTGSSNTFIGKSAGDSNTTGFKNTVIGFEADVGSVNLSNATAIGSDAVVTSSNSLVLGSINGVNGATATVKVGIGVTAPTAKLHIETDTTNLGDNTAYFTAPNIGPNASRIHFGASGDWYIRSADGAGKVILQDTGGNVGVGTNSPADRLHVAGDIRVGTGTTGCVKDANGTVIAGTCSSDLRLKKDITPFHEVLTRLVKLQPVHFCWRSEEYPDKALGESPSFGLIAQDVEQVIPELVTVGTDGVKLVRYNKLPLLMLQAIKELKAENDTLRKNNVAMATRITALERIIKHRNATQPRVSNSHVNR